VAGLTETAGSLIARPPMYVHCTMYIHTLQAASI
jgi:hypothetical protein